MVRKVVVVGLVGLAILFGGKLIDRIDGDDCGDFNGMAYQERFAATKKVLEKSSSLYGNDDVASWIPAMESYCRANPGDDLDDIEPTYGLGF